MSLIDAEAAAIVLHDRSPLRADVATPGVMGLADMLVRAYPVRAMGAGII